jgi:hypothetical protein
MVESAIYLATFLLIILGMLELALVVFQYNCVSEAARQGVRMAIVRGSMAPGEGDTPLLNAWGPTTYDQLATDDHEIVQSLERYMTLLDPEVTSVRVEWLDGNNDPGSRVRFTVSTSHTAFMTDLFWGTTWQLTGSSTMEIVH